MNLYVDINKLSFGLSLFAIEMSKVQKRKKYKIC